MAFMILGIILLCVVLYVIIRLFYSYYLHKEDGEVKLEFSEFIKMYSAAPEKYDLGERFTTYESYYDDENDYYGDYDRIIIYFSFLDYIQYRIWFNKIEKQKKAKRIAKEADERSKRQQEFLNYVAKDMEEMHSETQNKQTN